MGALADAYFSGKKSGSNPLADAWSSGPPQRDNDDDGGLLGALTGVIGAAVGDVKDIAMGLGHLASNAVGDVVDLGAEAVDLVSPYDTNRRFETIEMGQKLPGAIVSDLHDRYVQPFREEGLSGLVESVLENPVDTALDITGLATGAGSIARAGAKTALKSAGVKAALESADELSGAARMVDRVLPGARKQAQGVKTLSGENYPLGGIREQVFTDTGKVREVNLPENPVRRAARNLWERKREGNMQELDTRIAAQQEALAGLDDIQDGQLWDVHKTELHRLREIKETAVTNNRPILGIDESLKLHGKETFKQKILERTRGHFRTLERIDLFRRAREKLSVDELEAFKEFALNRKSLPTNRLRFDEVQQYRARAAELDPTLSERVADAVRNESVVWAAGRSSEIRGAVNGGADGAAWADLLMRHPVAMDAKAKYLKEQVDIGAIPATTKAADRLGALTPEQLDEMKELQEAALLREAESAERLVEITAGEVLGNETLGYIDGPDGSTENLQRAIEDTRLLTFDELTTSVIDNAGTATEILNRLYLDENVRVRNTARPPDGPRRSYDPEAPKAETLDEIRAVQQTKAPIYYPHYSPETTNAFKAYFMGGTGGVSGKRTRSLRQSHGRLSARKLKGAKQAISEDIDSTFALLANEITMYESTAKLLGQVEEMGVNVGVGGSAPPGWKFINTSALEFLARRQQRLMTRTYESMADGYDEATSVGRALQDTFNDEVPEVELAAGQKVIAVPEIVAKKLSDDSVRFIPTELNKKLRFWYDTPMQAWRRGVLYYRPAYYLNNLLGNSVFLGLKYGPGSVLAQFRNLSLRKERGRLPEYEAKWNTAMHQAARDLGVEADIYGTGLFSELQRDLTRAPIEGTGRTRAAVTRLRESGYGRGTERVANAGQRLGREIEQWARSEAFVSAAEKYAKTRGVKLVGNKFIRSNERLQQLVKLGVENPNAVRKWVDELNDVMNNYEMLNPVEQGIIRRFLLPFYPFYKHSAKILVKLPVEHPGKAKLMQSLQVINEQYQDDFELGEVPEYLEDYEVSYDENGDPQFRSTRGVNPLGSVIGNPLSLLAPVPQMMLEQTTGRDVFTGLPFQTAGAEQPYGSENYYSLTDTDENGNPVLLKRGMGGVTAPVTPGLVRSLMDLSPPLTSALEAIQGGRRYSADPLAVEVDRETGEPVKPIEPLNVLLRNLGFPAPTPVDLDAYQSNMEREQEIIRKIGL